jgi:hypothetical protein
LWACDGLLWACSKLFWGVVILFWNVLGSPVAPWDGAGLF